MLILFLFVGDDNYYPVYNGLVVAIHVVHIRDSWYARICTGYRYQGYTSIYTNYTLGKTTVCMTCAHAKL